MEKKHTQPAAAVIMSERHYGISLEVRKKHSSSAQLCRRIDIILLAKAEQSNLAISEEVGVTPKTVRTWRNRWADNYEKLKIYEKGDDGQGISDLELRRYILSGLKDAPRSGMPKIFTPSQEQQIVALACDKPIRHGVEITDWTHEMLAKTAIAKNIVSTISSSQVGRLLKNKPPPTAKIRILVVSQN